MTFNDLNLIEPITKALQGEGYTNPTPIQEQAIPVILQGKDLLGCAQTGTGKTAAFAIPTLQLLSQNSRHEQGPKAIKALILTPTRELAIQIGDSFAAYGKYLKLNHLVIYGGVSQLAQTAALSKGVDILIATPGRLLDLMNQKFVHLHKIQFFVLDEADRMLDMGFVNDVKRVISKLPEKRQTLFFSATMPPVIQQLADSILTQPVKVEVTPVSSTAETINQSVYMVDRSSKKALLNHILEDQSIETALVFSRTKHGADRIARDLNKGKIKAEAIHGDKSQNARQRALSNFKSKEIRVLVATDIAARGIDIDELTHVINFDVPYEAETYVHRIGRTGRAGANGSAFTFCDAEEMTYLKDITKLIGKAIPTVEDHPFPLTIQRILEVQNQQTQKKNDNRQNKRGNSHNKNKGATQHSKKKQHRKGTPNKQARQQP
ncbi:DEAD/DEAH box helicase [Solitalea lacus]|uniref:DEAD/DEAH box helicase n=1 Tax=Solitalea lacus TaxID=2911172 RepID=UPI001EDB5A64|nr:DEAD/DEAH box helicase [Solitalea lacus]UKJ07028.1 DEAD/DEAH box helicase [Solitalea lacus]